MDMKDMRDMILLIVIGTIVVVQLIWFGIARWREESRKFREEWEAREKAKRDQERQEEMLLKRQQDEARAELIAVEKAIASRAEAARTAQRIKHRQEVEEWDWKE